VAATKPWTTAAAAMRLSLDRHRLSGCAKTRRLCGPFQARVRIPGQTVQTPDSRVEPVFQGRLPPPLGKHENPESELAGNDAVDGGVWLMCAKPGFDARIADWFRRLAQNVGIDSVLHRASVDSDSIRAE
jgi:hypothetical protein